MKYKELSANTVAFISCRSRLTKVLAGAAGRGGGRVRLSNVDTRRVLGLKYKLIYCFILAVDIVGVASESL